MKQVRFLRAEFGYGGGLFRLGLYLRLSDLDGSMIALFVNKALAEKAKAEILHAAFPSRRGLLPSVRALHRASGWSLRQAEA